jgi:ketosteroid isomerase-like protein
VAEGNVEIVRAWMGACNADDTELALSLCDPSIVMIEPDTLPGAATTKGIDGVRRYFAGWQRNWSEWRWEEEVEELPPDKVLVTAQLRLRGLRSGIWVEHCWAYVFTLRDGKLVRQQGFDGRDEALAAVQASE